jgi:hypothetical protein
VETRLSLVLGLTLCCLGEQTATGQPAPASSPNADPDRVRAIVRAGAEKAGTQAVVFGTWVHDREVLTMALGHSMTTVPATTDMLIASAGSPRPLCPDLFRVSTSLSQPLQGVGPALLIRCWPDRRGDAAVRRTNWSACSPVPYRQARSRRPVDPRPGAVPMRDRAPGRLPAAPREAA